MIDEIRRVYRALDQLLAASGHGAIARTQAAAGVGASYLRDVRARLAAGRAQGYDFGILLRMLGALDVDRRTFFGRLFGTPGPIALCQLETRRLGRPPELVARVRDLLRLEEWRPLPEVPRAIRDLDAHRYVDANEAQTIARGELAKVAAGLGPLSHGVPLLAVYGSALRMTDDYEDAQQVLVTGLEVAEPTGDLTTLGDLLQRLAYVVAGRCGDYRRASRLARRATDFHVQARDLNSVGKTFVDRGLWLYKLGELEEAIRMQQTALEYLAADEHHNRFAALHILGVCHRELRDLENAQAHADRARELAAHVGPWLVSNLQWLDARIALDRRQLEKSEKLLRETIQALTPISAEAAALATTELIQVLLLQQRSEAAHETAETMAGFIIPLEEKSPAAAEAALDLLLCGQAGYGVDSELVDRVSAVLEKERARRDGVPAQGFSLPSR